MRRLATLLICITPLLLAAEEAPAPAAGSAQDKASTVPKPEAKSLDDLLRQVREGSDREKAENSRREEEFRRSRDEQQRLLEEAQAALTAEEARSERLEAAFDENEIRLAQLEATLTERLGNLGELFGVVRQVAGDTRGHIESSLVSAQIPDREPFLYELGKSKKLPKIEALETLWHVLLEEMTESGKVVRFPATVVTVGGDEVQQEVVRAGVFNAIADGKYLVWSPDVKKLRELARQPEARYLDTVRSFETASNGTASLAVDPSRGAILGLLVQEKRFVERLEDGGNIGYAIIAIGLFALLVAVLRGAYLFFVGRRVAAQQRREKIDKGNPLGRVLSVFEENRGADPETLELKLDEVILKESASLDRFLWLIKVVSVVAPLMGLLGTVTGMIKTFQAITLYGTGDPKLMASGISEALVTTMLGLYTAIPLVLAHAMVSSMSKRVSDVLDEQSAGLIAQRAEGGSAPA